jgi:GLPGLI family protein
LKLFSASIPGFICGLALLATIVSCGSGGGSDELPVREGVIVYELTYPQFTEDNIFTSMFPSEMSFKFKDNDTKSELKTKMAVFSTAILAEHNNRSLTHLVRIANKYSGLVMDSAQIMNEYGKAPEDMVITHTDQTKLIAGFNCQHARVTFGNDSTRNFDLYYTNDIAIEDPNWCTPFHEIKGVLMEARVNKFNIDMHMVAKSVTRQEFPEDEFKVTQTYESISVEEMADIFQSF